jgi:hypothetical protein
MIAAPPEQYVQVLVTPAHEVNSTPSKGYLWATRRPKTGRRRNSGRGSQQNPQSGGDHGKAGQDTDGDGKVVKPGQPPGQSGGQGLDK